MRQCAVPGRGLSILPMTALIRHLASRLALVPALLLAGVLLALPVPGLAQQLQPIPALQARVTDRTGTLTPAQAGDLEAMLADLEQRKGSQVVVLMVPTTAPEAIEQYGIRVAEAWKIGRGKVDGKAVDDGVILLVATRLVRALRHTVELEQRIARLQEGVNLLADTTETGFRQVAVEIERLSQPAPPAAAPIARPTPTSLR